MFLKGLLIIKNISWSLPLKTSQLKQVKKNFPQKLGFSKSKILNVNKSPWKNKV